MTDWASNTHLIIYSAKGEIQLMVIRREATASTIERLFDVCNRIFKNGDCFYTNEELEQERTNEKNIFLKKE